MPADSATRWTGEQKIAFAGLLRIVLWSVLIVAVVYMAAQFLAPGNHSGLLTPGKYQIALKYHLTEDQVFMDPKPAGCDFSDAPVGEKHCHFEQDLNIVRECPEANCPVTRVYVSWRKVAN